MTSLSNSLNNSLNQVATTGRFTPPGSNNSSMSQLSNNNRSREDDMRYQKKPSFSSSSSGGSSQMMKQGLSPMPVCIYIYAFKFFLLIYNIFILIKLKYII